MSGGWAAVEVTEAQIPTREEDLMTFEEWLSANAPTFASRMVYAPHGQPRCAALAKMLFKRAKR